MMRRARLLAVAAGAALALSACQTVRKPRVAELPPPPAPAPAPVAPKPPPPPPPPPAPAPKSCVPKSLPPAPRYPDTDAALRSAPGAADRYQLLAAGRILREQRLDQLEAVVAGCR
jgi:hypothetical protein